MKEAMKDMMHMIFPNTFSAIPEQKYKYVPVSPFGTELTQLAADTEDEAWQNLARQHGRTMTASLRMAGWWIDKVKA